MVVADRSLLWMFSLFCIIVAGCSSENLILSDASPDRISAVSGNPDAVADSDAAVQDNLSCSGFSDPDQNIDQKIILSENETYNYGGQVFQMVDGNYLTEVLAGRNDLIVAMRNPPWELENISVEGDIAEFASADFFYLAFDPSDGNHDKYVTMAMAEIAGKLNDHFTYRLRLACTKDHPACRNTDTIIANCTTTSRNVIFIDNREGAGINISGNCADISGTGEDLIRSVNRFMYMMYGIME